jgi:putrescine aminotransferase
MGEELLKGFKWIQGERELVSEVRALGLIGAVELKSDKGQFAPAVVAEAAKRGLICRSVIFDGMDILVFAPPLTINKQEINSLAEILHDSIFSVEKRI